MCSWLSRTDVSLGRGGGEHDGCSYERLVGRREGKRATTRVTPTEEKIDSGVLPR